MALVGTSHAEGRVHMHIVRSHVQSNKGLENKRPSRPSRAQEDEKASSCATVGHHVKHCAERSRLVEIARRISVQSIQQAGYAVKDRARSWVEGHVVEGCNRQNNSHVSYEPENISGVAATNDQERVPYQ